MKKTSLTYYYVQCKEEGKYPETVFHTVDEEKQIFRYKIPENSKDSAMDSWGSPVFFGCFNFYTLLCIFI